MHYCEQKRAILFNRDLAAGVAKHLCVWQLNLGSSANLMMLMEGGALHGWRKEARAGEAARNRVVHTPVAVALCIQSDRPFKSRSRISAVNS